MADDDKKTESPLDKFKSTMRGLIHEVLDERDAKKTAVTKDEKSTTDEGGEKKNDWLGGLFGG